MQCPSCDSLITHNTGFCNRCGTAFVAKRVRLDPGGKDFSLTADENDSDIYDGDLERDFPPRNQVRSEPPIEEAAKPDQHQTAPWGGFIRRAYAFVVDCAIMLVLGLVMILLSYVGYKVGLSAHGRSISAENSTALFFILTWGWIGLSAAYFVIFHGIDGQTIGKWIFGLRVVGADKAAVTYRQAFIRWLAEVGFAPILLGFLWVIFSREKRAWHDIIARTWVIKV